jgi:hypothetical protein
VILKLAWKTLVAHPVRTAVLGVGFGLGVSVMATLLGVGEVVLDQARAPSLAGGGDVIVSNAAGRLTSARFVLGALTRSVHATQPSSAAPASNAAPGVEPAVSVVASPHRRADLFLVRNGAIVPVYARSGIPSLERALGDPETSSVAAWTDTPADAAWSSPDPADVLRAMDRFHAIPDVPARANSWAEWLYFKGRSGDVQFYLTFLAGAARPDGRRVAGVRLQLDRAGQVTTYSASDVVDGAVLLAAAPDVTIGGNRVRLDGMRYRITLDLDGAAGEIVIDATPGRSLAPLAINGAGGWVSGYVVPVMSGALSGVLSIGGARIALAGLGYHDHNWGFWEGVSWRWGQVQHEGLSYIYGRVRPPADAADPDRIPGVLVALGPDGPVGYATRVSIDETDDQSGRPQRIVVTGRSGALDLTMDIAVESAIVTHGGALDAGPDFLQLRAHYHVTGRAGGQPIDFTAPGAAETFRGR